MPVPSGKHLVEPTVARVGSESKWVAICRQQQSTGLNAVAYTLTDMTNWSGPTDTGQQLSKNPPELLSYREHLYWIAPSREGAKIGTFGEAILHQSAPASDIYNDPSAWDGWQVLTTGDAPRDTTGGLVGYFDFVEGGCQG